LRDIGFGLEQVHQVLDDAISVEELRGMLRLRRAQIEQDVGEELERLPRPVSRWKITLNGSLDLRKGR
jgi:hypothetical protein